MGLFNFFKPKWQHRDPTVRMKAAQDLPVSDCQVLLQLASTDPAPQVRRAALSRIDDWRLLTPLVNPGMDVAISGEINTRVATLQRQAVDDAHGLDAKLQSLAVISNDQSLAEIVLSEAEPEIRLAAIERIGSQAVLADLVTNNCGKAPALLAIERIDDESLLRMAAQQASNRVARARAQVRLQEIESARNKPDPVTERNIALADLVEKARLLTEAADPEAALSECRQLQRRWREIAGQDQPDGYGEFETYCTRIRSRQQEHATNEAARREAEADGHKRLDRLRQIPLEIESLATTATGEEESHVQVLQQEWDELSQLITPALPDPLVLSYQGAKEFFSNSRTQLALEKSRQEDLLHLLDTVALLIEQLDLEQALAKIAEAQRTFDGWRPGLISRQPVAERLFLLRDQHQAANARRAEMERLRLEANWQKRQQLLAEASSLRETVEIRTIEKRFAEIKSLWEQPVELPPGAVALEPEFATVAAAIAERLEAVENEESWRRWQNKNLKGQLIKEAEALNKEPDLHWVFKRIKELQEQWRTLGPAPAKEEPVLWQRFRDSIDRNFGRCKAFFQVLEAEAERNLQQKIGLRDEAIACQDSTAWQKTADHIKDLQARWKAIGRGPRDKEQQVYTAFRGACDYFFARRKTHQAELDQERRANLGRKEALCEQAEFFANQPDPEHKGKFQELQNSWKSIGPVPREQEDAIWQRFRTACDQYYSWLDSLRPENLVRKEALCAEAEELTAGIGLDTNFAQVAKKIVGMQRRWKEIGPVPDEVGDAVWTRFKGCCDNFFQAKAHRDAVIDQQRPANQAQKEAFLSRVRELSAAPEVTRETAREIVSIQEAWQKIGPAEKDKEQQLQLNFKTACDLFFKERREAFEVIDQLHRDNLKKKDALCLRLEILAGVTSQPATQQGKHGGMTLAEQLKVAFETNFVLSAEDERDRKRRAKDEIDAVSREWPQIGPVPREHEHAIRKRYHDAMSAATKIH